MSIVFENTLGKIFKSNSILAINFDNNSKIDTHYYDQLLDKFESIYLEYDKNFILIWNLSCINPLQIPRKIYSKLISMFKSNPIISDSYLKEIIIITENNLLIKMLKGIFQIYRPPQKISFVDNNSINSKIFNNHEGINEEDEVNNENDNKLNKYTQTNYLDNGYIIVNNFYQTFHPFNIIIIYYFIFWFLLKL